jgi:hypothetical protein
MFHEIRGDLLLVARVLRVLTGKDDGVDTKRGGDSTIPQLVFAGDVCLGIRPDPVARSILSDLGDSGAQQLLRRRWWW